MKQVLLLAAAAVLLAGCGEQAQTAVGSKRDSAAFQGTGMAYAVPGWKQGDKTSWEQQLRVRTQGGQNEYTKTP